MVIFTMKLEKVGGNELWRNGQPHYSGADDKRPRIGQRSERPCKSEPDPCGTTHKKYGLKSNAANKNESIRSGEILSGSKSEDELISSLREGVYLSNLHYLNWSNKKTACITGMTRYGCYYINSDGEIFPINDMRFNVSLYDIFGDDLVDLSSERMTFCEAGTYDRRELGGMCVPGMLTKMTFTL